ncbi:MAG TPA: lysylphosphatidylglycerol synthase transmembrane domain-containing protein [Dehalococcoidia bacterium]|nr:lysylphosphatidylglycerol synthase transmembrane domain-containing protein [Dehalococcoidia bacterium]
MMRVLQPRQLLRTAAQTAVSAALVALLLWRGDLDQAVHVARDADYFYLPLAFPAYLLANLLVAVRWRIALPRTRQPPLMDLYAIFLTGMLVNRLLPMRLGDVLRVQVLARRFGLRRAGLTALIFITETLLDGLAFVFLFLATLAFLGLPQLPLTLVWALSIAVLTGLLMATAAARLELAEGWQDRGWFRHLPEIVRRPVSGWVPEFLEGLAVLKDASLAGRAVAATFAAWLLHAAVFYLFGQAFGLDLSLAQALIVTITAALVVSVPLAPFNLGTYEVGVAGVLVLMGASNAEAVAYALGSHVFTVAFAALAGFPAMWAIGLGIHDLPFFGRPEAGENAGGS